ncbi:hypothetical protein [Azospirillum sp.]|uniref:hypothetical protein n=1 Tax=Azospirillum sp. TaxID=34012 RepID=UPI00261049E0|nr:hypothetical protein [Azospirillum sp.]
MNGQFLPETGIIENVADAVVTLDVVCDHIIEAVGSIRSGNRAAGEAHLAEALDELGGAQTLMTLEGKTSSRGWPEPA